MKPVPLPITTRFKKPGSWAAGYHTGEDYAAATGNNVVAASEGTVVYAGQGGGWGPAYGIHVVVRGHDDLGRTRRWAVCHLSRADVKKGDKVKLGQRVGLSGNTGNTTGPHVHFEVRRSPYEYVDHVNPKWVREVVTSMWAGGKVFPGAKAFRKGKRHKAVKKLRQRLDAHKIQNAYTFDAIDIERVKAFQKAQGWTGKAADGYPGKGTWDALMKKPKKK